MLLTPGTRLGPYEIIAPIGAGGMGEVYRAKDTRLDRDVALKILPDTFGTDPDRVMRFTREAKTLAALNHPHIAQVYDAGKDDARAFIAMELVDGDDLSQRIARGAIPIHAALPMARQIADALAAAHDAGIVHRDLKPANIKITDDGVIKVLDFGLAKAFADDVSGTSDAAAATMTSPAMTAMGLILGTASYMSPEQAKGRPVDRRADVWAFGVVLYEILTGTQLFGRDDLSDTLAAVLTHEPDVSKLPPDTPASIRRLIERCLVKDKKTRLDSMSVARHEIDDAISGKRSAAAESRPPSRGLYPIIVAASIVSALAAGMFVASLYYARQTVSPNSSRLAAQIPAPVDAASAFQSGFAVSPDGSMIAFAGRNKSGISRIWLRRIDTDAAHEVAGTDDGIVPFWAPDSRTFAFFADDKLKRVDIDGGSLQTVCDTSGTFLNGSWSARDQILWVSESGAHARIHVVPAAGGASTALDALGDAHAAFWLSNGQRFIYSNFAASSHDGPELRLAPANGQSSTHVLSLPPGSRRGMFAYGGGFVFFNRNGTLAAQRFDESSGAVVGQPVPIAPVAGAPSTWFAVSSNGDRMVALVGATPGDLSGGNSRSRLVWADRAGNQVGTLGEPGLYWQVRIAPDGKSAIVPAENNDFEWLRPDLPPLRVTTDAGGGVNVSAVWHASGAEFIYVHAPGTVVRRPIDPQGQATIVIENLFNGRAQDWSRDGRWLFVEGVLGESTKYSLILYDFATKTQRPWLTNQFENRDARFSPDGKWVAYASDVSGRMEVYLRAFEGDGQPTAVSAGGGLHPFWRGDGAELFYLGPTDEIMSVPVVRSGTAIVPGKPKQLFRIPLNSGTRDFFPPYGVSPDGQRFLLNVLDHPTPLFLLQGLSGLVK